MIMTQAQWIERYIDTDTLNLLGNQLHETHGINLYDVMEVVVNREYKKYLQTGQTEFDW